MVDNLPELEEELEIALTTYEQNPTDGELHRAYVDAMQRFSEARREWRVQEEEAGRRVPGVVAEVND